MDKGLYITPDLAEDLEKLTRCYLDENGKEILNPRPLVLSTDLSRPPSLAEQIQRVLRKQVSDQAMDQGFETFEQANDFDVGDTYEEERTSRYDLMDEEFLEPAPEAIEPEAPKPTEGDNNDSQTDSQSTDPVVLPVPEADAG